MRLSTSTLYAQSARSIQNQQGQMARLGEQLATGRRIVTPSDDPRAAAQALTVQHASDVNQQFVDSRVSVRNKLATEESELDTVTSALQAAKPLLVRAGNGTLSDADRASIADQLEGVYNQLLGSANAQDGNGRYVFGGYKTSTQPFQGPAGDLTYQGGNKAREINVVESRTMATGDTGDQVFNGVDSTSRYVGTADAGNTGDATFAKLNATDTSNPNYGQARSVVFDTSGAQTEFSIVDSNGNALRSNVVYTPGESIDLGTGASVQIQGDPENGDRFGFGQQNDILNTIHDTVEKLRNGTGSGPDAAALSNSLSSADARLGNALDNVLSIRASLGARLNELDTLDTVSTNQNINYQQTLSSLEDVDVAQAISDYSLAKVGLQASQKTFADIQQLSLFSLNR